MAKIVTDNVGEFYQHYPNIAVIITAQSGGKKNAMAAAWHATVSFSPPLYAVSVSPKRSTYQLIVDSKQFAINFLPYDKVETVARIGGTQGKEVDKFNAFKIAVSKSVKTEAPVLQDAYAAYECCVEDNREYGDHHLFIGRIVAVHMTGEAFNSDHILDLSRLKPILYLGHEFYTTASGEVKCLDRQVYGKKEAT